MRKVSSCSASRKLESETNHEMKITTKEHELEARVNERTSQLARANEILLREIAERQRSEQQLADLTGRLLRMQDEERTYDSRSAG